MPVPVEQPKPDDEICAVLEHARELASTREPLYEWDDLCEIIQSWYGTSRRTQIVLLLTP